jgi:uncharacterized membrane protein
MHSHTKSAQHPFHPIIVGFPITLYVVAVFCFAIHALGWSAFWFRAGVYANLGGVLAAIAAGVPGFIDVGLGIPTRNPSKASSTHTVLNIAALLLLTLNVGLQWSYRLDGDPPVGLSVALPLLGVALILVADFASWKLMRESGASADLSSRPERLEPRATPRIEPRGPDMHPGHGQPVQ